MLNKNNKVILKHKDNRIRFKVPSKDIPIAVDETEIPYISIYYYPARQTDDVDIVIPLYITDFYQREYACDDYSARFTMRYELDGVVKYIHNVLPGDFNLNLGKLKEGEHWYTVEVRDEHNRVSRRICNDILIVNKENYAIKPEDIYTMTSNDLSIYSINNQNSTVVQDMINNRVGLTKLLDDKQKEGYRKVILLPGTYRVNRTIRMGTGNETPISMPSNLTVDMNGSTFKMHEYTDAEYGSIAGVENLMVRMKNCFDSHIINGTFEGDFFERQANGWISGSNGEHSNTLYVYGGKYNSIENITVKQTTGYNICSGQSGTYGNGKLGQWVDNLTIVDGVEIAKEGYTTSKLGTIDNAMITNNYIVASTWLGYGNIKGDYWDVDFHFYNNNDEYIETIKVYQFTRCRIPFGATKFRVTFKCSASDIGSLSIHHMNVCRYFEVNNCHWIDNRTCAAPFQSQHYTYNNCTFTRSGQSITPCEIDLEDGWEQQQDIFIRGCEILEQAGTGDIIDNAGINHVVENCKGMNYTGRYKIIGTTFRNNIGSVDLTIGARTNNTIRVYNNTLTSARLGQTERYFWNNEKAKVYIKKNTVNAYLDRGKEFYTFDDNTIIDEFTTSNYTATNCEICRKGAAAYINGNIDIINSTYKLSDGETISKFSYNVINVRRVYKNCIYECPCHFANHNYFNSGHWVDCTFKETVLIQPKSATLVKEQIQFNNCVFEKEVTIDLGASTYMQLNNCQFLGGIVYKGTSSDRCEVNDFVPTDVTCIYINKPLEYLDIRKKYELTAELIPYTAPDSKARWSTNNNNIATFDNNWLIPKSAGDVDVIATSHNNLSDVYSVKIADVDYKDGVVYGGSGDYTNSQFGHANNRYDEVVGVGNSIKLSYGSNINITYGYIVQYDEYKNVLISNGGLRPTNNSVTVAKNENTKYVRIAIWRGSSENKIPEFFATYNVTVE